MWTQTMFGVDRWCMARRYMVVEALFISGVRWSRAEQSGKACRAQPSFQAQPHSIRLFTAKEQRRVLCNELKQTKKEGKRHASIELHFPPPPPSSSHTLFAMECSSAFDCHVSLLGCTGWLLSWPFAQCFLCVSMWSPSLPPFCPGVDV